MPTTSRCAPVRCRDPRVLLCLPLWATAAKWSVCAAATAQATPNATLTSIAWEGLGKLLLALQGLAPACSPRIARPNRVQENAAHSKRAYPASTQVKAVYATRVGGGRWVTGFATGHRGTSNVPQPSPIWAKVARSKVSPAPMGSTTATPRRSPGCFVSVANGNSSREVAVLTKQSLSALALALLNTTVSCGGRSSYDSQRDDAAVASAAGNEAGTAARGGGGSMLNSAAGSAVTENPAERTIRPQTCTSFLAIWRYQLRFNPPGTNGQDGILNPCKQCLQDHESSCDQWGVTMACGPSVQCVERHCLCPVAPPIGSQCASEPPDDLCGCLSDCSPLPVAPCNRAWDKYLSCLDDACIEACH